MIMMREYLPLDVTAEAKQVPGIHATGRREEMSPERRALSRIWTRPGVRWDSFPDSIQKSPIPGLFWITREKKAGSSSVLRQPRPPGHRPPRKSLSGERLVLREALTEESRQLAALAQFFSAFRAILSIRLSVEGAFRWSPRSATGSAPMASPRSWG